MDLGRQPWSRFAVFLVVMLLLGVLQRRWLLVSVDVVLLGSVAERALEGVGEQGYASWPSVRTGWPGGYLVWRPAALTTGVAAAYLGIPNGLLMPMLAVATAYLLVAPPDENRRPLDGSRGCP
ncbi:MAG TPA: hypothetical protein VLR26_03210 [Frankiaceae bacterium]|nr:hypothetical protein [Frankiaceae bacterium]